MDKDHAGDIETVSIDPVTGREDEFMQDDNFSFSGYQIAREEFFAHAREPALIITGNRLYANKVCLNKAPDAERILIMVDSEHKKIIIKPCSEEKKDSIQWITSSGKMKKIICKTAFCAMVSEVTGWNLNNKYKMIGKMIRSNGERFFLFDMSSALVYPSKSELDDSGNLIACKTSRTPIYNASWAHQFGLPVEEHERTYALNRFDDYVVISVQDTIPKKKSKPQIIRE